ncbi:Benzoate--CoA ligase [Pigmentiphaga humi]|uniref:Benzoate--CoA ligase n=1 Tax=Pigmentiphaga humi TaxID=2478468 RepID=A0A3P4BBI0_9BURK|nr:AMP-binding protein [Pigmentiphaga humi]VCU72485.1 Benzoate--CoA ligase [Pigmentiphaga humi]
MERSGHRDTFTRDHLPPPQEWPDFLLDHPALAYPVRLNSAAELVDGAIAAGWGDRPAIRTLSDGQLASITYRELQERVDRTARVLVEEMGLVPGNRVLLRGPNNPAMAVALLATIKAGLVAVPTMPLLRAVELKPILDKAEVAAALCDVRLRDELETCMRAGPLHSPTLKQVRYFNDDGPDSVESLAARKSGGFPACDTAADDVCLIAFTSGTTGSPKGCMHFHRDVLAMCDLFPRSLLQAGPDDIFCGTPPLAFTFGLGGMLCFPLRAGASTVLAEKLTPATLLETIQAARATVVFTAPTFYRQMAALASGYDLSSLRHTVSAGEALPDATRQSWKAASGVEMTDGIGSTEMIHIFISSAGGQVRRGAIGKPVPGYEVRIVDEGMRPLPAGTVGRLAVKGPTGCKYLADERQARAVRQGWNLTGDSFLMDDDGYLYYQARTDDMIISAGYNIAGPEVESALLQHEAVAECGVVGMADEERGEVVAAYVVLRPGAQAGDAMAKTLQDHVKRTIAPYKYPRVIRFVEALPRTETGKLKRFALRSM